MTIVLGPYLIPEHQPESNLLELNATGYSLQVLLSEEAVTLPIYLRKPRFGQLDKPEFGDYFYPSSACRQCHHFDMTFRFRPDMECIETEKGRFYSISTFIAALYQKFEIALPVWKVIDDFADSLPIHTIVFPGVIPPEPEKLVVAKIAEMGFLATNFSSYGRSLTVDICYVPKSMRWITGSTCSFYSGSMEFRPKADGSLGRGKWSPPWEHTFWDALHTQFLKEFRGFPIDALSNHGITHALESYDWTPLARMTVKEAKMARLRFISENYHLHGDLRALAKAMVSARLYSENTGEHQIVRFLRSMVASLQR